jgi:hypothetical protein
MISVILYGRNDTYGYNLHKRGAISLNCLAALLPDPDDEILFVDCNTPNELPTFVEAIYDTLTAQAKARLRVLRVRPELHWRMVGYTHLMVVEPPPRNIAIRRSNPRNYWILNTNTDILLVPRPGFRDLTDVVRGLADGLYTLPRFELPEPLWESFPRADAQAIIETCRDLGPRLHLDEVTLSYPESRYDQVGDFMLSPRQALFDIHGFDERMVHGWHCDSNVCRRLNLYYGGHTGSLADRLKGYHCDHTRVQTGMHQFDMRLDNNVNEFVFGVDSPFARHQAETWGLPDEPIEELDFVHDPPARYVAAVERTLGAPQEADYTADAVGLRNFISVQAEHVLPYVASDLTVYPRSARFAYIGNHARMLSLIARCVTELGFETPLAYAAALLKSGPPPDGATPIEAAALPDSTKLIQATARPHNAEPIQAAALPPELLANYDLLIFDFSLDAAGLGGKPAERITDWPRSLRYSLGAVARCLEACAELAGAGGTRVPDFLAINANHYIFRNFAGQFLLLTETPFATHVRKGRPRLGEERLYRSRAWKNTEDDLRSYFGYDVEDDSVPPVALDQAIDFTSAGRPAPFKDGRWGAADYTGTWTDGDPAFFVFQPPRSSGDVVVSVRVNEAFIGPEGDPIQVEVLLDGVKLAHWSFFTRFEVVDAKADIPAALLAGKEVCRLEFHVENPQSASRVAASQGQTVIGDDPRMLGIKVQRIVLRGGKRLKYRLGEAIDFMEGGNFQALSGGALGAEWSLPGGRGSWTLGSRASFRVPLDDGVSGDLPAAFAISDCIIFSDTPTMPVVVKANGYTAAEWVLDERIAHRRFATIPAAAIAAAPELTLTFEIAGTQPMGIQLARAVIGASELAMPRAIAIGRDRFLYQRLLGLPGYTLHVARILAERWFR